ncbi:GGDEF domain-containing protein [Leucothrix sargassi]|nr:GGDEF domain-containing protein [Leucothrix sargassi]
MIRLLSCFFGKSIKRMIISSFVLVLLLPVAFFIYSLFQNSWEQVEQGILEKHHLISSALVEPFTQVVTTKQHSLHSISANITNRSDDTTIKNILDRHIAIFKDFTAVAYSPTKDGPLTIISTAGHTYSHDLPTHAQYSNIPLKALPHETEHSGHYGEDSHLDYLSSVFKSKVTGESVVLLKHYIEYEHEHDDHHHEESNHVATIYAEVSLANLTAICDQIKFGVRGHCAVVDHIGNVISHPNKTWAAESKNLASVSVVQQMIAGESGTTEFFSPFLKATVIVGFSAVPKLGWGIMIPQPKSEVMTTLHDVQINIFVWLLLGVIVALALAATLARQISHPIETLIGRSEKAARSLEAVDLGQVPKNSPYEIYKLWRSFSKLLAGLSKSHLEVKRLNESLNHDIQQATNELREKNKELYKLSILDHLTSLPNRRYFTEHLDQLLLNQDKKQVGVIFIDIDYFKQINDTHGHEAGDTALIHLAGLLKKAVRKSDLVARLGGDEFIIYVEDASEKLLREIAENILRDAQSKPFQVKGEDMTLSLSLGTISHASDGTLSTEDFFKLADQAMYQSKTSGRNKVTSYLLDSDHHSESKDSIR